MCLLPDRLPDQGSQTDPAMLKREHFEVKETAVTIITDQRFMRIAKDAIFEAREIIEKKIMEDPFFKTTYDPYPISKDDDLLIQRMCEASLLADVGPMASVAGAVSEYSVKAVVDEGGAYVIVENGGDIALCTDRESSVGLFTGDLELADLALAVPPTHGIEGICSSSGTVGPSVSFGNSGVCTVFSDNVVLADAAATKLGNLLRSDADIESALQEVVDINGIKGCIAFIEKKMALLGEVPELIRKNIPDHRITKIRY